MGAGAASASRQQRGSHTEGFQWWWEEDLQLLGDSHPCRKDGRTSLPDIPC